MSGIQVKGKNRFQQLSGPLSLALFVLLRGSDSTLLKWLQLRGASIAMDEGIEVISFCNVFFFSTLVSGVGLVLLDRRTSCERFKLLTVQEKQLLAWQTVLGFFLPLWRITSRLSRWVWCSRPWCSHSRCRRVHFWPPGRWGNACRERFLSAWG